MNDLGEATVNLIPTFEGVFDGNDHTIANLIYHVKDEDSPLDVGLQRPPYIGLFRVISGWDALVTGPGPDRAEPATGPHLHQAGRPYVGALVGKLESGLGPELLCQGGTRARPRYRGRLGRRLLQRRGGLGVLVHRRGVRRPLRRRARRLRRLGEHLVVPRGSPRFGAGERRRVGRGLRQECAIEDCFTTGTVTGSQAGGLVGFLDEAASPAAIPRLRYPGNSVWAAS